jgi:hypothetical protein
MFKSKNKKTKIDNSLPSSPIILNRVLVSSSCLLPINLNSNYFSSGMTYINIEDQYELERQIKRADRKEKIETLFPDLVSELNDMKNET